MAEASGCAGPSLRYFCTAGRGLEPFLLREVRARLGATQVEYVSGKVFFTTNSELSKLKTLKSGERLFLLLKKHAPISLSRNKGTAHTYLCNFSGKFLKLGVGIHQSSEKSCPVRWYQLMYTLNNHAHF
ncbi:unnamed protein product [Eretmochelys imbricata]